jgi:hypothetical protein
LCCIDNVVYVLCLACSGFGSTDANPKACSQCPSGTFNEGPLPRAEQPEAFVSLKQRHSSNRGGSSKRQGRTSSTLADGSDSSSSSSSYGAAGGSITLAEASTVDALLEGVHSSSSSSPHSPLLDSLNKLPQQQQQQQSQGGPPAGSAASAAAVSVAAAVRSAAVLPQQFINSWGLLVNSGVNPVFYEPTFNPCTPCGPACWTDRPGATSPNRCGEGPVKLLSISL